MLDFVAVYEQTSTTALSAGGDVAVPVLTINNWILMQRKIDGGSVDWLKNWAEYRDGFGSIEGNDNYWLRLLLLLLLLLLAGTWQDLPSHAAGQRHAQSWGNRTCQMILCKISKCLVHLVKRVVLPTSVIRPSVHLSVLIMTCRCLTLIITYRGRTEST